MLSIMSVLVYYFPAPGPFFLGLDYGKWSLIGEEMDGRQMGKEMNGWMVEEMDGWMGEMDGGWMHEEIRW